MQLVRYGPAGQERPGLVAGDGTLRDLSGLVDDIAGTALSPRGLARLRALDPATLPVVAGVPRLGCPVAGVGKIVCIGRNYADHAAEMGGDLPAEPLIFLKATSSLAGPSDEIAMPRGGASLDWEVELAAVIGSRAAYVTEAEAADRVAGYMAFCDVTERDFQKRRAGQWTKGKSADTFGPAGPWLVTADAVRDPQALRLSAAVDGVVMQDDTTANMVFGVAALVSYLSQFMSLQPGDIIATGTPSGVGAGMTPPRFLHPGQTLTIAVEGLGTQSHPIGRA